MKMKFSCTLNAIIRGSLCSGIDQFPTLFLLNLSQGKKNLSFSFLSVDFFSFPPFFPLPPPPIFLFPIFFLLTDQWGGGGGRHGPLVPPPPPLSYASANQFQNCCIPGFLIHLNIIIHHRHQSSTIF